MRTKACATPRVSCLGHIGRRFGEIEDDSWDVVQALAGSAHSDGRPRDAIERPEDTGWEDDEALRVLQAALATPEQRHAFESFVNELLRVLTHSILVTIDGGTEYSDAHGTPQLVHGDGQPFGEALHELFMDHLVDTGRHR